MTALALNWLDQGFTAESAEDWVVFQRIRAGCAWRVPPPSGEEDAETLGLPARDLGFARSFLTPRMRPESLGGPAGPTAFLLCGVDEHWKRRAVDTVASLFDLKIFQMDFGWWNGKPAEALHFVKGILRAVARGGWMPVLSGCDPIVLANGRRDLDGVHDLLLHLIDWCPAPVLFDVQGAGLLAGQLVGRLGGRIVHDGEPVDADDFLNEDFVIDEPPPIPGATSRPPHLAAVPDDVGRNALPPPLPASDVPPRRSSPALELVRPGR